MNGSERLGDWISGELYSFSSSPNPPSRISFQWPKSAHYENIPARNAAGMRSGIRQKKPSPARIAAPSCRGPMAKTRSGAAIVEHDLEQALASITPDHRGLRAEKKSVKCESCQAISIFDPDRAAQRCDFCGSPSIVPVDALKDAVTPESLLPSVIPATQVRDQLRAVVWQPLVGAEQTETRRPHRHAARHLPPLLDLRRPRRCRLDRRVRLPLLRHRDLPRRQRKNRHPPGPAHPLGTERRAIVPLLR